MRADINSLKSVVSNLVLQLQLSSAELNSRPRTTAVNSNTSPTRSNFEVRANSPDLAQPIIAVLATTSNDASVYTIDGTKKLFAKVVLANYILFGIAKNPANVVINGLIDYDEVTRFKNRIATVIKYMREIATADEISTLDSLQPKKNSSAWSPWHLELLIVCGTLQDRAMELILVEQNANLTADEIAKSRDKEPTINGMEGRIKKHCVESR
jgi:phosphopantetheine adenylyltransferase